MTAKSPLTICTVSFESAEWLRINLDLTRRLNPGCDFRWLVAENSAPDSPMRLEYSDSGFEVFEGAKHMNTPYGSASYHHAAGLDIIIRHVSTRYLLILDPDFFIVRKNWIQDIISHMQTGNVAILGTPWHPKRVTKIRYFPSAHCTFIDLEQINKDTLDFSPDYEDNPRWVGNKKSNLSLAGRLLANLTFAKRRRIASSRDTGWRIFDRYHNQASVKIECFQPVFQPKKYKRLLENLLPDHLSFIPKRPGYFTEKGFEAYGLPNLRDNGWEEFLWQNKPLGFHVRCFPIRDSHTDSLKTHLDRAEIFLSKLQA